MRVGTGLKLLSLLSVLLLAGCVVRTYELTRDRVDQNLVGGNKGYLAGQQASQEAKDRKETRTTQIVELELNSPIKFERRPKQVVTEQALSERQETDTGVGNRGYITQSYTPSIAEQGISSEETLEQYTVKKGDTLEKISKKFYGTTKKWHKIFEANKDILKGPDKIYPGQVINVPSRGGLVEPQENLK